MHRQTGPQITRTGARNAHPRAMDEDLFSVNTLRSTHSVRKISKAGGAGLPDESNLFTKVNPQASPNPTPAAPPESTATQCSKT